MQKTYSDNSDEKQTGEVMSIGTNFEGALMKAIRSLEQHVDSLLFGDYDKLTDDELLKELEKIGRGFKGDR